eukprot:Skav204283  [mRNA]  locus=scaffold409:237022:238103:+ [translate_table: standard]
MNERGIEFSTGRCEIWTRPEGIEASISLSGFMCYRAVTQSPPSTTSQTSTVSYTLTTATVTSTISLTATTSLTSTATLASTPAAAPLIHLVGFRGVDGGFDRVCRGGDANDNNPSYFEVFDVDDLEACKDLCRSNSSCVGVESINRTGL